MYILILSVFPGFEEIDWKIEGDSGFGVRGVVESRRRIVLGHMRVSAVASGDGERARGVRARGLGA